MTTTARSIRALSAILLAACSGAASAEESVVELSGGYPYGREIDHREVAVRVPIAIGGAYVAGSVLHGAGNAAATLAHRGPSLAGTAGYGAGAAAVPVIGTAALMQNIPTSLGQAPFIGGPIARIPVVGHTIAGTPQPWLVGVAAIDTYVVPKYNCAGYTESALWAARTDANSPPRLSQFTNYLAPLPYTHPPIFARARVQPGHPTSLPLEGRYPNEPGPVQASERVNVEY